MLQDLRTLIAEYDASQQTQRDTKQRIADVQAEIRKFQAEIRKLPDQSLGKRSRRSGEQLVLLASQKPCLVGTCATLSERVDALQDRIHDRHTLFIYLYL